MRKVNFLVAIIAILLVTVLSCQKDEEETFEIELRDRTEEAATSQQEIETYLSTHFYNYEEFQNPTPDFDMKIIFDTIAGANTDKIPLMDQVSSKTVKDALEEDLSYKLYYLTAIQGGGESPNFPDLASITYRGTYLNNDTNDSNGNPINSSDIFDSAFSPLRLDLNTIVVGLRDVLVEFQAAADNIANPDGTTTYTNFGVGAAFIPTGLGYFFSTDNGIPIYSQLIFTFQMMESQVGDQDSDKIPSIYEDINSNGTVFDDDTNNDGEPNFADADDDGDGRLTINEVVETVYPSFVEGVGTEPVLASNEIEIKREREETNPGEFQITITTITLTDSTSDGTPDYLDPNN